MRRAEHHNVIRAIAEQVLRPNDRVFVIAVREDKTLGRLYQQARRITTDINWSPGDLFGESCPKHQPNGPGLKPVSYCGESPLWNAVYAPAKLRLRPVTGRKALLMLTDGFDTGSTRTLNDAHESS